MYLPSKPLYFPLLRTIIFPNYSQLLITISGHIPRPRILSHYRLQIRGCPDASDLFGVEGLRGWDFSGFA